VPVPLRVVLDAVTAAHDLLRKIRIARHALADAEEAGPCAALIEQVTDRITKMADQASAEKEDEVATELFAIERALTGAKRRLVRFLGGR